MNHTVQVMCAMDMTYLVVFLIYSDVNIEIHI